MLSPDRLPVRALRVAGPRLRREEMLLGLVGGAPLAGGWAVSRAGCLGSCAAVEGSLLKSKRLQR